MHTDTISRVCAFVFAHPDDEFGCLEALRLQTESGCRVVCVYLTDGAYGGQSAGRRIRESRRALVKLGVAIGDIHFIGAHCGFPDGKLVLHLSTAYAALVGCLRPYGEIQTLFAPAWEGGHQDHDASHLLALYAARELDAKRGVEQYSLYNGLGLSGLLFRVMSPLPANGAVRLLPITGGNRLRYLVTCMGYPSQWRTWLALMPFVALKLLFGAGYALQVADMSRLDEKPHEGSLLYERRGMLTWEQFESFMRNFRGSLSHK